jgi:hypothetical protein
MCTVTIIPNEKDNFVLTSNRDEAPSRVSLAPDFYNINNTTLLFPKDEISNGTWIGVSEKNRVVCLLNGAFEKHERKENYRQSRGVVVKDFMLANTLEYIIETYNFEDIEPFTLVLADWNNNLKFFELVWDGKYKYVKQLPLEANIWSSSTLYDNAMKQERLSWFDDFKLENDLNTNSLLEFHKTAGKNNKDFGVIMDRGFVKTTSITQISKHDNLLEMHHENLQNQTVSNKILNLSETVND